MQLWRLISNFHLCMMHYFADPINSSKMGLCEGKIAYGTLRLPLTELSSSYHNRFRDILEQIQ